MLGSCEGAGARGAWEAIAYCGPARPYPDWDRRYLIRVAEQIDKKVSRLGNPLELWQAMEMYDGESWTGMTPCGIRRRST